MSIWQLCANLLIPNCLRSNLSYSPLAALELYVNIPITQKQYCDSTYTAWVSGYKPSLDSIRLYKKREVVTINKIIKEPPNRFVVTFNVGYGLTPQNGLQPYIGVGVGYKLFSFGR